MNIQVIHTVAVGSRGHKLQIERREANFLSDYYVLLACPGGSRVELTPEPMKIGSAYDFLDGYKAALAYPPARAPRTVTNRRQSKRSGFDRRINHR